MVSNNIQSLRNDVDNIEKDYKVTTGLDDFNYLKSPYSYELIKTKINQVGWVISNNSLIKSSVSLSDEIVFYITDIPQVKDKIIKGLCVEFEVFVSDGDNRFPQLNKIGIGGNDVYCYKNNNEKWYANEIISIGGENELWDFSLNDLKSLIDDGKLTVSLDINSNLTNKTITLKNPVLIIYFSNEYQYQAEAVNNRLGLIENEYGELGYLIKQEGKELYLKYTGNNPPEFLLSNNNLFVKGDNLPQFEIKDGKIYAYILEDININISSDDIDDTVDLGDDVNIKVKIVDSEGNELYKLPITLFINNVDFIEGMTNNEGVFEYSFTPESIGIFSFKCIFEGDEDYHEKTNELQIEVI